MWKCYLYLLVVNRWLLELAAGRIPGLLINLPPRHGKSTLISRYFPVWYTGIFPSKRILLASYEGNFASSWGLKARDTAQEFSPLIFGSDRRVRLDVSAASNWQYRGHEGGMTTAGVRGPITGKGGDILILDDPVRDEKEAMNRTRLDEIWEWFRITWSSRLEPGGGMLVIQTRWNEADPAGRILADPMYAGWVHLSFPAMAEENDPLGRSVGQALCPDRYDEARLEDIRAGVGGFWWSSVYQQNPRAIGGNIWKAEWFKKFRGDPPGNRLRRIQVLDSAHKTKTSNDFSVITTMDETTEGVFIRHVWRDKVPFPELKRKVAGQYEAWGPDALVIEDKDAGAMIIQELESEPSVAVIPIQTDRDKIARAHAASPLAEAGKVGYDEDGPWVDEFLKEITAFPKAPYDDQADTLAHGINYLKGPQGPGLFFA